MNPHGRLAGLTGLRGVAAWWVVLYHLANFVDDRAPAAFLLVSEQGYMAVDLFFMLSGFVLALSHGDRFSQRLRTPDVRDFLQRRVARVYPAHWVVTAAFVGLALLQFVFGQRPPDADLASLLRHALLIQTWGLESRMQWNPVDWSLSAECLAYLAFPALAFAVHRVRGAAGLALWMGLALGALAWGYAALGHPTLGRATVSMAAFRCMTEFIVGVGLARAQALGWAPQGRAGALLLLGSVAVLTVGGLAGWPMPAYVPVALALLLWSCLGDGHALMGWLGKPLAVRLGELSYATYLVHMLVKDVVKRFVDVPKGWDLWLTTAALTAILSVILHHAVELPWRDRLSPRRRPPPSPQPALPAAASASSTA